MNKNIKLFLTLLLISFSTTVLSQEICDNGIDDDGDGRIDCYDGECSEDGACEDFFFGNVVECADDIDVTTFAIRLQWGSEDRSSNSHATPMVGDLDGNGIPEVVATNKQRKSVFILNGATGATLFSNTSLSFQPENVPVLGDIDGDEFGEILVSQDQGDDMALLDNEANIIWTAKSSRNDAIGLPGFADFDEDGDVEIYYRNEVVDALTGNVIVAGTNSDWEKNFTHGSLAVDVLPDSVCADCNGLELISGNEIWAINETAGTRTLIRDMDDDIHSNIDPSLNYYPKYYSNWDDQWSSVSAADYNLDGSMDLIITGALGTAAQTFSGETTIFFWDVANNNVITFHDPSNNFVRGPGRVNIGDVDGDGQLNANFVMNQKLYSLDENFNIHWIRPIKEGSSGFTGCSLFDFDGDGATEVVYRSEESLLIVDGIGNGDNTTNIRNEIACVSRTQEEYPVIADVDGDGASEICLACYTNNSTPFSPYSNTEFAQVRIYESDGEAWMPARGVWNQHAYYNVNVNDDLTIPTEVQDHTVIFSEAGTCEYSDGTIIPFDSRPLNSFLNQAPILNDEGCVEFASPDIEFVGILNATDAECPDATIEVTFEIRNIGDIAISGNLPVSYYAGDPRLASGSTLLDTEVSVLVNFEPETTIPLTQTITGVGGAFELFVVINDNGSTPPISVPLPTATIPECDTENNIQNTSVGFTRFDLISEKLNDNRKCDDALPDNGSAHAYYFGVVPGENGTFWVENFEDRSNSATSDTDETGWTSDPGTGGPSFYGVNTYQGSKMFSGVRTGGANDSGEVTWTSEAIDISDHTDVTLTLDLFENGKQESSGKWRDYIIAEYELRDGSNTVTASGELTNGRQFGNFTYAQALRTGINNAGQDDSLLTVIVTIHNTSTSEFHYLDNVSVQGTPEPVPSIQTEADGFVFNWYNLGDTTNIIHTGSTISQLAEGDYIVEGYYDATLCFSALDTITIERSTPDVFVWAYEITPETNCSLPDGSAEAFAYTQTQDGTFPASLANPPQDTLRVADGYQVTWRINGDVTNTVIATGNIIENKSAQDYAADIVEDFTGCFNTAIATITSPIMPIGGVNTSAININTCGGTGTVSANVNGNTTDYTFEWFDGPNIKPTEDFIGANYTVNDVGDYTVVARENATGCPSDPITVTVGDDSNSPIITAAETQSNQTCGANPTGIAEATVNGSVGPAGFDYTWFVGANTLPANEIPGAALATAVFGVGEWEMTGLSDQTYTIIVEELSTNCTDTTTVFITDGAVIPSLDVNVVDVVDNTSCGAANGSIDASNAISPASSYVFALYTGFSIDINNLVESNSSGVFSGLSANDYTIAATDNTTDCITPIINVAIVDDPDDPVISTSIINDSFCIDGDGQITVTSSSDTEPGSYTYEIFDGFSFASEIVAKSNITVGDGATGHTFMGLEDGNYRIRVTNDNLTCDSFVDVTVTDISVIPSFSTSRLVNDNTSCDAANPNGAITVSVDEVGFDADDYTWEWYEGASVVANKLLSTPAGDDASVVADNYTIDNNSISGLPAGDFTVFARDNSTGCKTVDLTLTIIDDPYLPNVIIVQESPQTDCDDGNGVLRAYVDDPDLPCVECIESDGFTFQWQFGGVNITEGGSLANGSDNITGTQSNTISGLVADNYSVIVIETNTQCDGTSSFALGATQINPVITFDSKTPNTICDDANAAVEYTGSITVTSTYDGSDFTNNINAVYQWHDGDDTGDPIIAGETGPTLSNQPEGFYTVLVSNADTGCPSNPITVEILENHNEPAITFSGIIGNSVCDPAFADDSGNDYNGEITADVTGGSGSYSYQWFSALDGQLAGETNATLSTVIHGSYTVEVTDILFGCVISSSESIPDIRTDPNLLLANVTPTDVSVCTGGTDFPNGAVTVSEVDGFISTDPEFSNYSFEWFSGAGTGTPHASGETSNTLSNVDVGEYTVRVVNDVTGCTSVTRTVEVEESLIDINAVEVIQHLTDCTTPNGSIQVTASMASGAEPSGYTFEWFFGSGTTNTLDAADVSGTPVISTSGTDEGTVSVLDDGTYTVRITNNDTQCDDTFEFDIENNQVIPTITAANINVVANKVCDPLLANPATYDGTIDPTLAVTPTIASGVTYQFELFDDADVSQGTSSTTFTNVGPGNYTIVATITDPVNGGVGCASTAAAVVVGNNLSYPDIALSKTDDTSCNSDNGQITIDLNSGSIPADGFDIEVFQGTGTSTSQEDLGNITALPVTTTANLASGTYTVQFINRTTGCSASEQIFVDETPDKAIVDSATPTPNTFCVNANGTIAVVSSNEGTNPTFNIYAGGASDGTPDSTRTSGTNTYTWQNLPKGTYTVTVSNGDNGCESDDQVVVVGETLDDFSGDVTSVVSNEQSACDLNSPTGQITADVLGATSGYTFQLFSGTTTNVANEIVANITTNATEVIFDSLANGNYTVLITSTTSGCTYSEVENITTNRNDPVLASPISTQPNTRCDAPDGEITVEAEPGPGAETLDGTLGYRFQLFNGTVINPSDSPLETIDDLLGSPATATFSNYEDGDYVVRIIDLATKCEIDEAATINYSGPSITVDMAQILADLNNPSDCFDRNGQIDLTNSIEINNPNAGLSASIIWYLGTDTTVVANKIEPRIGVGGDVFEFATISGAGTLPTDGAPATIPVTGLIIDQIPAVSYTALVYLSNGCTEPIVIDLPEFNAPTTSIDLETNPTRCSAAFDGRIDFSISGIVGPDDASNYQYALHNGFQSFDPDDDAIGSYTPPLPDGDAKTRVAFAAGLAAAGSYTDLAPGDYTLVIQRTDALDGCPILVYPFTMDEAELPEVTLNTTKNNEICSGGTDDYDGTITIDATHPSLADNFTFEWFVFDGANYVQVNHGDGTVLGDNDYNVSIVDGAATSTISGIGENEYRVIATHTTTTCMDTLNIEIFDDPTLYTVNTVIRNDQVDCNGFGNFTLDIIDETNSVGTSQINDVAADFTVTWLRDGGAFAPDSEDTDADLLPGSYDITAVHDGTGCEFTYSFDVDDLTEDPDINLTGTSIVNNTICVGGPGGLEADGSITIEVREGGVAQDPTGYTIDWYLTSVGAGNDIPGSQVAGADISNAALSQTIDDLPAGTYVVEVEDNTGVNQGCTSTATFIITDDQSDVEIQQLATVDFDIQHQTDCSPGENGSITINNVYIDGIAQDAATGNFEFTWYESNMTDPIGTTVGSTSGANNQIAEDLPADTYFVEVLNEDDDCVSALVSFEILDETEDPNVQLSVTNVDSECETATGNGSIEAQVVVVGGGFAAVGDYIWTWYEGGAVDANFLLANPEAGEGPSTTVNGYTIASNIVSDLPSGQYTVEVTDNTTDGQNCTSTQTITIDQFTPIISITDLAINKTPQTNCTGQENGTVTVTELRYTLPGGGVNTVALPDASWDIDWYDAATGGAEVFSNTESISGLTGGTTYFINARNINTGCFINPRKAVTIESDIPPVTLTLSEDAPDNFCAPVTEGNGQISLAIDIDGVAEDATHYTIEWFEGSGTGTALGSSITTSSLSNNDLTVSDIPDGTYTVRVTKDQLGSGAVAPALNCVATAEITLASEEEEIILEADVDYTRTPNTVCDPAVVGDYNGSITISDITEGGAKVGGTAGYSFTWTLENGVALPVTATVAGPSLSTVQGGIYEVTIQNDNRNCTSEIIQIEVEESLDFPSIALTNSSTNTHCDGATALTGSLEATVSGGTGPFTFEWFVGDTPGGSSVPLADISTLSPISTASNLDGGSYTVIATDPVSGCTATGTYFVDEVLDIPTLDITTVQANAQPDTLCAGTSGTIIINDADISGGDLTLYNVSITDGTGIDVAGSPFNATAASSIEVNGLDADDYSIDAVNITTNCEIATGTVTIDNLERDPLVTLESLVSDKSCAPGVTNGGEISVIVDGEYDHSNPRFTFLWEIEGGGALPVAVADNEATLSNIPSGNYQVTVSNINTGCDVTRVYEVPNETILPIITQSSIVDNTNCTPFNGSFELLQVSYGDTIYEAGGAVELDGAFELIIYRSSDDSGVDTVSNVPYLVNGLTPDDYYALISHSQTTCTSDPLNFTIGDTPTLPEIDITLVAADSTCQSGFTPNAIVTALANGVDHSDPDYSFQWYFGQASDIGVSAVLLDGSTLANGSTPVGFDESTISGLASGIYSVEVTQASNGCVETKEISVPNAPIEVEIIDFNFTSSTNCYGNGTINITEVNRNGVSHTDMSGYIFEFYTQDPSLAGSTPVYTVPTDSTVFASAIGDLVYYIVGTDAQTGCTTPVVQTIIPDEVIYPEITLPDFSNQSNCDPDNPNGRLRVLADGQPENSDYDFQWYFGSVVGDTLTSDDYNGGQNLAGADSNEVFGLAAGTYTVEVMNLVTGCTSSETYIMSDDTPDEFAISTSVSSNTNCEEPNGILAVNVVDPVRPPNEYNYYWFIGNISVVGNSPDTINANFRGSEVRNLPSGSYVVMVIDAVDNYCNSVIEQVDILDEFTPPQFELETNNVTVCFDDKDGYAEVVIDDLSRVDITWYNDMIDSIGSGFFVDSLDAGLYTVRVVNRITNCPAELVFEIFNDAITPNAPFVIVSNGRDNCSEPNGSAIANVDGVTNNYLFEWFEPEDLNIPYATGFQVNNLDTITYLVKATDITTGCESPFTQVTIDYEQIDPVFEISVDNSICLRTEDGSTNQFTGTAVITFEEFQLPTAYEWIYLGDDNFVTEEIIGTDSRLIDAFPGNYAVRFVAENGCDYYAEFQIETTLNIYNGVSANGDGKNDFFLIDCIDYFPNNNVKIFNRAGQRIWEDDKYDNRNVRFDGISNVGGGGLVLPSGTYFYLVDLGTGEDPIQGYLELVR